MKITLESLAKSCGVSRQTVDRWLEEDKLDWKTMDLDALLGFIKRRTEGEEEVLGSDMYVALIPLKVFVKKINKLFDKE